MTFLNPAGFPGIRQVWVLAGLLVLSGCADGRVARYPVSGTLNVDGQPAEGAIVIFCPVSTAPEADRLRPAGRTDASGKFDLTTIELGDGAPAGDYKVLVRWPEKKADDGRRGRGGGDGPDRLQGKYFDLENATLTATVEEHTNQLPPFELKSK
jgi:hypothetical protein